MSPQIELTKRNVLDALSLAKARSRSINWGEGTRNSSDFMRQAEPVIVCGVTLPGGKWFRDIVGAIGETVYGEATGQPVDIETIGRGDAGVDFTDGADVKTGFQPRKPNLFVTVHAYEKLEELEFKGFEFFVQAWWHKANPGIVEFVGKIDRKGFEEKRAWGDESHPIFHFQTPTWYVRNHELSPVQIPDLATRGLF